MTRYQQIEAALEPIRLKFNSGNSVPVERAVVLATEWNALIAALALPEDGGWQPIETAPKDGTVFQGWLTNSVDTDFWEPRCRFNKDGLLEIFGRIDYDEDGWDHDLDGIELKRWQPLPNPPKDAP